MDNNINIEEIMAEIKREIKEKGLTADMLSFEEVPCSKAVQVADNASLEDADKALSSLSSRYFIQPYKPVSGSRAKVFFKKVIRKLTKFYVEPIVFEQNEFNAETVSVLKAYRGSLGNSYDDSELASRIEAMEKTQNVLLERVAALEKENAVLREELGKQDCE